MMIPNLGGARNGFSASQESTVKFLGILIIIRARLVLQFSKEKKEQNPREITNNCLSTLWAGFGFFRSQYLFKLLLLLFPLCEPPLDFFF